MKHIACVLCAVAVMSFAVAETSCIVSGSAVDEKYVATASAAGFDILGAAFVAAPLAVDLRSSTRDISAPMTVHTTASGLAIIFR